MKQFHKRSLYLAFSIYWLATAALAGVAETVTNQSTVGQETQPKSGSGATSSASKEKAAKKSSQDDVQSRGLFQKKKKKQKGGSAGNSQPAERTDPPTQ